MLDVSAKFLAEINDRQNFVPLAKIGDVPIPIQGGSVTLDSEAATRGSVQLDLAVSDLNLDEYLLEEPEDLLAPYGNEIVVFLGLEFIDGVTEWVQVGVFRIDETVLSDSGTTISVTAFDRSAKVIEEVFLEAGTVPVGTVATDAIRNLLADLDITYSSDFDDPSVELPALYYDAGEDRWDFCQGLAEAVYGSFLYFDNFGVLTRGSAPDFQAPAWAISEEENLVSVTKTWGREGGCNRVVVYGESAGSSEEPVKAEKRDEEEGSPTHWDEGGFGHMTFTYSSEWITTEDQANEVASTLLALKKGTTQNVSFEALVNPALEPLDVVSITRARLGIREEAHVIDRVTFPLGKGTMSVDTRLSRVVE